MGAIRDGLKPLRWFPRIPYRLWISRVRFPYLLVVSRTGKLFFTCPRSRLRIWSGEMGSAIPSRVSLLILHAKAESGASSLDSTRFPRRRPVCLHRQPPSGQSRVFEVTRLRTDGVHCRESAGAGPVVPEVAPLTGAAFAVITMDQSMCADLFPHPLLVQCSGHVRP